MTKRSASRCRAENAADSVTRRGRCTCDVTNQLGGHNNNFFFIALSTQYPEWWGEGGGGRQWGRGGGGGGGNGGGGGGGAGGEWDRVRVSERVKAAAVSCGMISNHSDEKKT